ncbi:MAG: hypothetical protein LCH86_20785 [Proteobacteria bacterium]|nr:hypothetical protein [Pseudomonadota bacterium]
MSQYDFGIIDPNTKSGSALATDLVSWRNALHSGHRGNVAPAYAVAGLQWVDDTNASLWLVKRYDGTNWIVEKAIDTSSKNAWVPNLGERLRYPVAGGSANALTLTPAVAIAAYLDTDVMTLEAAAANTAAATLNVSGVGAKAIRKIVGGADVALVGGDILAGGRYTLSYKASAASGAGAWILVNPAASGISFGSSNAASATDLTKHIALFSTTHGFSVTGNRLNYVAPTGVDHVFVVNGTDVAKIGSSGLVVGAPTGGPPGSGKANAVAYAVNGNPLWAAPDAVLEDQKAAGSGGGSPTITAWTTHVLNTEVRDPYNLITLSSNQFVATVDGWVDFLVSFHRTGGARARLYNVTDAAAVAYSDSMYVYDTGTGGANAVVNGGGSIIAGKTYRIEYYVAANGGGSGLGYGGGLTVATEVYCRVKFWRA